VRTFTRFKPLVRPQNLIKEVNEQDYCEHDWQWFKERVHVEDDGKALAGGHERQFDRSVQFWFEVLTCTKCKSKRYSELRRETV
jgi:hypothetical protein